jgi:hypothetical protein
MSRGTDDLIRELASGLAPVRRIPRLRGVLALAAALAFAAALVQLALAGGVRSDLVALLRHDAWFCAIAAALALVAVGAPLAATAASVPGRDAARRAGLVALAAALAVTAVALLFAAPGAPRGFASNDVRCLVRAALIAAAPAAALVLFATRALPHTPLLVSAFGVAAGGAFGALAMHATCPSPDPSHWGWGHAFAPIAAVLVIAPLAWLVLRRRAR